MPSSLESLCEIRFQAIRLEPLLEAQDEKRIAKTTYKDLVDRFYRENEKVVAPQQYEAAKKDFEYFMMLMDLATAYHREADEL